MLLYRLLLRLYPAWFRAEYGKEMCAVFAARRQREAVIAFWARTFFDVITNAILVQADVLQQDLRWTLRVLRQMPGFTLTVIAVIALGIAGNTAAFALLDHVLLRPLPFAESHRLVTLHETRLKQGVTRNLVSPPNFVEMRAMSKSFDAVGAYVAAPLSVNLSGRSDPVRLDSTLISSDVFKALGVQAAAGRVFLADDDRVGGPNIVILSNSVAVSMFGTPATAIGETITIDGAEHTIIGVMQPGFAFPSRDFGLWRPLRFTPPLLANRSNHLLYALARLRPEVSLKEAQAEMDVIARRLELAYPEENTGAAVGVMALRDTMSPQSRTLVLGVFGAAVCLLLIVCTNLANLLFARAMERRREIAVRIAIGAARERLVRQLLTESLFLAIVGGTLGFVLAAVATPLLSVLVPAELPIAATPEFAWRVFSFAMALTLATSIAFGAGPAFRCSRNAVLNALRSRTSSGARRDRLRAALVLTEIVGTVVLLVAAGLLLKALWRVWEIDPGFRTDGVLTLRTALPSPKYDTAPSRRTFYSEVLAQVRSLQGVTSAAYVTYHPMENFSGRGPILVPGIVDSPLTAPRAVRHFITPGFFETLGIPLRRGRDVSESDTTNAPGVAIISESLAERLWPHQDPIGRAIVADGNRIVVGVAGEIAVRRLEGASDAQIYYPAEQMTMPSYYWPKDLLIHTTGDPMALAPAVRKIIQKADPQQAISNLKLLENIIEAQSGARRAQLRVLAAFAAIAFLLAAVGIYGLLEFGVSSRTHEIGVRMALGAQRTGILRMFLQQGIILGLIGLAFAIPLAYMTARGLTALLFGVQPSDPSVYGAAGFFVLAMTVTVSLRPALRAAKIDPATTIRSD
jgi:putative ABC transport system permease protein